MNPVLSNPIHSPSQEEDSRTGHTARFLRVLGALAIGGSGLLYMLQGLYHSDTDLRNWVYLALLAALGAGGIFSQRMMQDSKGARLFFALAVLMIPVQFSQLGGMILSFLSGDTATRGLFDLSAPAAPILAVIGGLSLLAAVALSYAGFSVLTRSAAKPVSIVFVGMNALLLLPFRDSLVTLPVLASLFALAALLEWRLFRRDVIFQTNEGLSVRLMLLLPAAIAVCRSAFHFSDTMGISAILGVSGFMVHYLANCQGSLVSSKYARELLWLLAFALWTLAFPSFSYELFARPNQHFPFESHWQGLAYTLPALACALYFSARAHLLSLFYQLAAVAIMCIAIAWVLDTSNLEAEFVLWCSAVISLVHGFARKQKIAFVCGLLATIGLSTHLIYSAVHNIQVNLWLALAIGGLVLMVLSSVCEKHGRKWLHNSREYWQQFNEWETR